MKYIGDALLPIGFSPRVDKPIDDRLVVDVIDDLYTIDKDTAYVGMPVVVASDGSIHVLLDVNKIGSSDGWAIPSNLDGYATEDYVDKAINQVLGNTDSLTVTEALDTLYELGKALGDDENFASNVTNSISKKLNALTAGDNVSINEVYEDDNKGNSILKETKISVDLSSTQKLSISAKLSSTLVEITGENKTVTLSANASVNTYSGSSTAVSADKINITDSNGTVLEATTDTNTRKATITAPTTAGSYTYKAIVTNGDSTAQTEVTLTTALRKFYGYVDSDEVTIDGLTANTNNFQAAVGETIRIPATTTETEYKYVAIAVPGNLKITSITQPDALNAPFAFSQHGVITRTLNKVDYTYKLYLSNDKIDSSVAKSLTLK